MAFVDPGDEVVLFEPFYDSYQASVKMAGGSAKYVRIRPHDAGHETWWFDETELAATFSERTALAIINPPNNSSGKVFTRDEYEHLVFAPRRSCARRRGQELLVHRVEGRLGARACEARRRRAEKAHQWVTFATSAPFHVAIATALTLPDSYFTQFRADSLRKRDFPAAALNGIGLPTYRCDGASFLIADISKTRFENDVTFCKWLTTEVKVAAIPPSVFYVDPADAKGLARFAFCKTDAVLAEAASRLAPLGRAASAQ